MEDERWMICSRGNHDLSLVLYCRQAELDVCGCVVYNKWRVDIPPKAWSY